MSLPSWVRRGSAAIIVRWRRGKRWVLRAVTFALVKLRPLLWPFGVFVVLIGGWLAIQNWDWLSSDVWNWFGAASNGEGRQETNSTTLRNIGLVVAGIVALPLAVWRSIVAQRQAQTAQQGLLNERYQQGAEMLGNEVLSVRLGGVYALQRLAEEHPEQYHVQIMRLFCAFARYPTKDRSLEQKPIAVKSVPSLRQDVDAVMQAIKLRSPISIALERDEEFKLDFSYTDLRNMILWGADLSAATFVGANLSGAHFGETELTSAVFLGADLSEASFVRMSLSRTWLVHSVLTGSYLVDVSLIGANLADADLSRATLERVDLSRTSFYRAVMSGAYLRDVKNLTQRQLSEARGDSRNPPKLENTDDAETGEPLVWRGKPLDDEAEPLIGY